MLKRLDEIKQIKVLYDENMAKHTTFRCGGSTKALCIPETVEALCNVISFCRENDIKYFVMGNGSNLLVRDEGFDGVIIKIGANMNSISAEENVIIAESGALLSTLSRFAAKRGLSGLEFAEGIPGTVGGAVYMNAGAYDGEIKDVLVSSTCLTPDGNVITMGAEEHDLGYRKSAFQSNGYILLASVFMLKEDNIETIKAKMDDFAVRRKEKQPLELPSAGSTFKRPKGYFAGKLIQDCGLKGYRIGGAEVSTKHSGFVVNVDNATATDVIELISHIKKEVKKQVGVNLVEEVRII